MTYHSNYMTDDHIERLAASVEDDAFLSRRDGCRVTLVRCMECERMFEEELEAAKTKIKERIDLLCLACDREAIVPAFTGVVIQIGWFLD